MTDKKILACIPVGVPGYTPGEGYGQILCDDCEETFIWIGPKQQVIRNSEGGVACCHICVAKHMKMSIKQNPGEDVKFGCVVLNQNCGSRLDESDRNKRKLEKWMEKNR